MSAVTCGMLFSQAFAVQLGVGDVVAVDLSHIHEAEHLNRRAAKCHQATLDACEKPNMSVPTFCNTSCEGAWAIFENLACGEHC